MSASSCLNIYRLAYDYRNDGGNDWHEVIVTAENESDAIAVCGFGAYPRDKVEIEHIGQANADIDERALICSGTHEYAPFEKDDAVVLEMGFLPNAEEGATALVEDVQYEDFVKYIKVIWDKSNPKWKGQKDSYYNAVWFGNPKTPFSAFNF